MAVVIAAIIGALGGQSLAASSSSAASPIDILHGAQAAGPVPDGVTVFDDESWHYELRPEAIDDGCPPMYADPTHDPRMQQ